MKMAYSLRRIFLTSIFALAGASSFAQAPPVAGVVLPVIPAPVPVTIDAKSSVLLILDISTAVCQPNPACVATVPSIASLAKRARDAKVPVVYSTTVNPAGPPATLGDVAPQLRISLNVTAGSAPS